jgi:hypothetical protein
MKIIKPLLVFLILITSSCYTQETTNKTFLHYKAQTRGFHLEIILKNNLLEVSKNNSNKKIKISEQQLSKINDEISNINFDSIKSNISIDEVALDKAIPATFSLYYAKKEYSFNFDHNKLPIDLKNLLTKLESTLNKKE